MIARVWVFNSFGLAPERRAKQQQWQEGIDTETDRALILLVIILQPKLAPQTAQIRTFQPLGEGDLSLPATGTDKASGVRPDTNAFALPNPGTAAAGTGCGITGGCSIPRYRRGGGEAERILCPPGAGCRGVGGEGEAGGEERRRRGSGAGRTEGAALPGAGRGAGGLRRGAAPLSAGKVWRRGGGRGAAPAPAAGPAGTPGSLLPARGHGSSERRRGRPGAAAAPAQRRAGRRRCRLR